MNEISYLSTFCDLIIGRNSGPFCFASNKENINSINKTFYAFNDRKTDCFYKDVEIKANYIFEPFQSLDKIFQDINALLQK